MIADVAPARPATAGCAGVFSNPSPKECPVEFRHSLHREKTDQPPRNRENGLTATWTGA